MVQPLLQTHHVDILGVLGFKFGEGEGQLVVLEFDHVFLGLKFSPVAVAYVANDTGNGVVGQRAKGAKQLTE